VPNPALTVPAGINYRVTVKDTTLGSATNGQEILRYKNVAFVGAGFNFDAYGPSIGNVVPLTGTSTNGSLSVNGDLSVTGSMPAPWGGIKIVDGVSFTTIQSAINAASTTGSVLIPSSYAGSDVYTNPNGVQIIDLRRVNASPSRQRGFINMLTDCGLKGDGSTDDATAAQACLNRTRDGCSGFRPQRLTAPVATFSLQP
jgi:hypothetical protein